MVNQDAGRFTVWQANTQSKKSEIVAVDKNDKLMSCGLSSSPTLVAQREGPTLSGGAIGGIVVGAVGGLAILAAFGFLIYRRRTSNKATGTVQEPELQPADVKPPTYSMVQEAPQELSTEQFQVIELDSRAVDRNE